MVHTTNGDFPRSSSEDIARRLLETARQDPSLLGRAHVLMPKPAEDRFLGLSAPSNVLSNDLLPISLLATEQQGISQQIEDLVSIAVASAQQAEDAVRQANEATGVARRSMKIFACLGLLGMLVGAGAIADHHLFGPGGAMLAAAEATTSPVRPSIDPLQAGNLQTAGDQPAPVIAPPPAPVEPTETPPTTPSMPASEQTALAPLPAQPVSVRPVARTIVPVYHPPSASHSAPWPPARPTRNYRTVTNTRVAYPPFFVALRRDVAALFRGFPPGS